MNKSLSRIVITDIQCTVYRFLGFLLFITSFINLYIGFRYCICRYMKIRHNSIARISPIMIGVLFSSSLVIFTSVPIVIVQCFTCQAYLSYDLLCKAHGFFCFASGLFHM